jgi:hypothetical protein
MGRIVLSVAVLQGLIVLFGPIGFRYPSIYENQPLENPVWATVFADGTLVLDTGERWVLPPDTVRPWLLGPPGSPGFVPDGASKRLEIDLEPSSISGRATVFAKTRVGFCGTPYAHRIQIPIFPDPIRRWAKLEIGVARVESAAPEVNAVGLEVDIFRPFTQSRVKVGEEVVFRARSLDRAGTSLQLPDSSIVWTSSLEGTLGTGHVVPVNLFEEGTHTITVRGTDARGATTVASITLVVDSPVEEPLPSVEILTPATDFTFEWDRRTLWNDCYKQLQLDARAIDNVTHERIPDERISWHTDRRDLQDPLLGIGRNPFAGPFGLFMSDCETTTQHVITCTVTDSRGNSRTSEPRRIWVRPMPHGPAARDSWDRPWER